MEQSKFDKHGREMEGRVISFLNELKFDFFRFKEVYCFDDNRMKLNELKMFNLN